MTTFRVSQSKVKMYRRCAYAYHLKYVENLRRRRVSRPFQFGRMVHSMLEAHANGDDPFETLDNIGLENMKLFRAEREAYGEIIEDIRCIMTEYFEHWSGDGLKFVRMKKRSAEHKFEVEIADGIIATGVVDAIVRTPDKLRWLVEHKTFTRMVNDDHRWRNLQSVVYIRVMEMLGWTTVDGTLWNYIRSKPPGYPGMLKNGTVSHKAIDTLPTRVREVIAREGLDAAEYDGLLKLAEQNRSNYFIRVFTPVKPYVVEQAFSDFVATAVEMSERHGKNRTRNIERHCEYCDYEAICRGEFLGSDIDYIKEKEYYVHQNNEDERDTPTE